MASVVPNGDNYQNQIRLAPEEPNLQNPGGSDRFSRMEARVARLEDDMKDVKSLLRDIQKDITKLGTDLAEVKGRVSSMPTSLSLITMTLSTWAAGAAIVFTLVKFAR